MIVKLIYEEDDVFGRLHALTIFEGETLITYFFSGTTACTLIKHNISIGLYEISSEDFYGSNLCKMVFSVTQAFIYELYGDRLVFCCESLIKLFGHIPQTIYFKKL